MPDIKILTEADLRALVPLDLAAVDCIEQGFKALAGGKVVMPPILSMPIHDYNGEVDVKTAYVAGIDSFAIKMSPGFFDNPKLGLPSTSGLMVLFSAKTGMLEALLLDNGYLTDLGFDVTASADAAAAIASADIVVTTTPSTTPLVMGDWLGPGQHITAMGSDQDHKNELDPGCLAKATLYVPDRLSQTARLGELRSAICAGVYPADQTFAELGDIAAGKAEGRQSDTDITIADLTGTGVQDTGVQDTAIATLARQRAQAAATGATFTS